MFPAREVDTVMLDLARRLALGLSAALALTCALPGGSPRASGPLVYVLIDGFRSDYLDRGITPVISGLAAQGVRSEGMRPSTPSVSAPNHYTLVTGLYPDHHGMVDNTFLDPELGMYGDEKSSQEPRFWEGATPLWVTAERQGVRTASAYWSGSNLPIHGATAGRFAPRRPNVPNAERVDELLAWMDLPETERPRVYFLYFSSVDTAGHLNGPDAPDTNKAIAEVDAAIGRLVEGLRARSLAETTNIVLVADHGMTDISTASRVVLLADVVDESAVQDTSYGATLGVQPKPGREAEVERALLRPHEHMTCWRKSDIPAQLHYGSHPRVPAIFCLAEKGWTISTPLARARFRAPLLGSHGFDASLPEMRALFVAHGPAFRRGLTIPPFDNIHVYPLVAHVIGVRPERMDGDLDVLRPALLR